MQLLLPERFVLEFGSAKELVCLSQDVVPELQTASLSKLAKELEQLTRRVGLVW